MSQNQIAQTKVDQINQLHKLASAKAQEAIDYAKQAGQLLLEIKQSLPHGQFTTWINDNLQVSLRQAQRYMNVAAGKMVPLRELSGKSDTMSHLSNFFTESELEQIIDRTWVSKWVPEADNWYFTDTETDVYWVVPDKDDPTLFHVSHLYDDPECADESLFDGTRWAEHAEQVEISLRCFGLSDPKAAEWEIKKKVGLTEPFGAPAGHGTFVVVDANGNESRMREAS